MEQEIITSPLDHRNYKLLTLPNQLQCLLISDINTNKSAASLMISIGMLDDPIEAQGLAHFLEHMLFMGSTKYPAQNDYSSFVQANSGETNASTSTDGTKYYFEIANQGFLEALDRFAQFFVAPLFTESCVEREINAVESEFNLSLTDDDCRVWEIFRQAAHPNSTLNKFGCGNLKYLSQPDIRDKLIKFYNQHYCASLMKLVIYSHLPLDVLEDKATQIFSHVPHKQHPKPIHSDNPFEGRGGKLYKVVSIKDEDVLYLSFPIKSYLKDYEKKPDQYLVHIFGHEGQNSLASYLKDEGLITSLMAGAQELNHSTAEFYFTLQLTDRGYKEWESVIGYVFKYIAIVKERGLQKDLYQELAQINQIDFQFKEKSKVVQFTRTLCKRLHDYPARDIIRCNHLYNEFDPALINEILDSMRVENLMIFFRSQQFKNTQNWQTEEICGTKYNQNGIPNTILNLIQHPEILTPSTTKKSLDIPVRNPYIAQNFGVLPPEETNSKHPRVIHQSDLIDLWYLRDTKFNICKGGLFLEIYPDQTFVTDVKSKVMIDLWLSIFSHAFEEKSYQAECASINYSLSLKYNSVGIEMTGFNDSLQRFYQDYIEFFTQFHCNPKAYVEEHTFDMYFEELEEHYENYFLKSPYDLTFSYWKCMLYRDGKYMKEDLVKALDKVNYQGFLQFCNKLFSQMRIQCLIQGNVSEGESREICLRTEQLLKQMAKSRTQVRDLNVIKLNEEEIKVFEKRIEDNPEEPNSGIIVYFQGTGSKDSVTEQKFELLNQILGDHVENQLRTNEQLGYVAYSSRNCRRGVHGFNITIISQIKSPNELALRIDEFVDTQVGQIIEQVDEETFNKCKSALRQKREQDYENLYEQMKDYWNEIVLNTHNFDKKQRIGEWLEQIGLAEFKQFGLELLRKQRRMEIHILNKNHAEQNKEAFNQRIQKQQKLKVSSKKLLVEDVYGDYFKYE